MLSTLINYYPYIIVFSVFNFVISLFYFVYGWVVYRKKAKKIKHSNLSPQQKIFLANRNFQNVCYTWVKKFGAKIRNFSFIYLILSEIICYVALWLTGKYLLICRISFFTAVFLLLLWGYLLYYYRKKAEILAEDHKKNLEKALECFDEFQKRNSNS